MVLLNEPLISTNPYEAVYIAEGILIALRSSGARFVFVAHYYKLASSADKLNSCINGKSVIVSLTIGTKDTVIEEYGHKIEIKKPYVIKSSPPECDSHAIYIA